MGAEAAPDPTANAVKASRCRFIAAPLCRRGYHSRRASGTRDVAVRSRLQAPDVPLGLDRHLLEDLDRLLVGDHRGEPPQALEARAHILNYVLVHAAMN